jgi:hypothetical protein
MLRGAPQGRRLVRTIGRSMLTGPHQVANQKWLDGLMNYYEELNKR